MEHQKIIDTFETYQAAQAMDPSRVLGARDERPEPWESNQHGGGGRSRRGELEPRHFGAGHGREWPGPWQRCRQT
jgi:hypothetical protein